MDNNILKNRKGAALLSLIIGAVAVGLFVSFAVPYVYYSYYQKPVNPAPKIENTPTADNSVKQATITPEEAEESLKDSINELKAATSSERIELYCTVAQSACEFLNPETKEKYPECKACPQPESGVDVGL